MTPKELRAETAGVILTSAFFCVGGSLMHLVAPEESAAVLAALLYTMFVSVVLFGLVFCLARSEKKEKRGNCDSRTP